MCACLAIQSVCVELTQACVDASQSISKVARFTVLRSLPCLVQGSKNGERKQAMEDCRGEKREEGWMVSVWLSAREEVLVW